MAAIATIAGLWFLLGWSFVAIMGAKQAEKSGTLTTFWKVNLLPLVFIGIVLDCAFNLTFATLLYRELPRELLFTARCKRHKNGKNVRRKRIADWWCANLNVFDPGHCGE